MSSNLETETKEFDEVLKSTDLLVDESVQIYELESEKGNVVDELYNSLKVITEFLGFSIDLPSKIFNEPETTKVILNVITSYSIHYTKLYEKLILLLDFFNLSANLKNISRQGWIDKLSLTNPESVADHTFSMAIIGMVLSDSKNYDTEKILKMILLHDLAESVTGDITPDKKPKNEKIILENKIMKDILANLPKQIQTSYFKIWEEYQENKSSDSKFVRNNFV